MAIPSRQIGWGPQENLLWEISKQLEKLGCQVCSINDGLGSVKTYGSFYDTTEQVVTSGQTAAIQYNTTDISNGVTIQADGNNDPTLIKVSSTGVYNIQFSIQAERQQGGGGAAKVLIIWLRKNGVDVPWTATFLGFQSNSVEHVASWNFFVPMTPSDDVQLMWTQDDDIRLITIPENTHPAVPSVILTVNKIS